eukprot:7159273-Ditylum_brightwellii.AAC.1
MSVPVSAKTTVGRKYWECKIYHGITCYAWHVPDCTFQNPLGNQDIQESGLFENVDMIKSCYDLVEVLEKNNVIIATDGSADEGMIIFDWKMCNAQGEPYTCRIGLAFGK